MLPSRKRQRRADQNAQAHRHDDTSRSSRHHARVSRSGIDQAQHGGGSTSDESMGDSQDDRYGSGNRVTQQSEDLEEMIKKLVRLALANEHRRTPLRRSEITSKIAAQGKQSFKKVFEGAQATLAATFGMKLMEMPGKEKVTVAQRRQAQKTPSSSGQKSYILVSVLPASLQTSTAVLIPAQTPTEAGEASYTGITSTLVSIIALSGGTIPESRLERYMKRLQIELNTPIDRTDRVMQRLCKDGYLVRYRDTSSGEEVIEYGIGTRAKVEIGKAGIEGMVKTVYGQEASEELDSKLKRSLQMLDGLAVEAYGDGSGRSREQQPASTRETQDGAETPSDSDA